MVISDIVYLVIAIATGVGLVVLANKTMIADCFDDDDDFFDFCVANFLRLLAFVLGLCWPVILPIGAVIGALYGAFWWKNNPDIRERWAAKRAEKKLEL